MRESAIQDPLARFLTSSRHFSRENARVKEGAFLPPPDRRLSVFQIGGLDEPDVWDLAKKHIAPARPVHGRADIGSASVCRVGLRVDPDDVPPRHANIVGWPDEKSERKLLAQELAEQSALRLAPC